MDRCHTVRALRFRRKPASSRIFHPLTSMGAGRAASCVAAAALFAITLCGCGKPKADEMRYFLRSHETLVSAPEYRTAPPDVIQINCAQAPEVDGEVQVIRSDGKIGLRLLGEVKIAGMTTQEAANKLELLLTRYYVRPQVNVRVVGYRSKNIFVFGEVGNVGAYPYTGRDTLLSVLAQAQPTFLGWTTQVKVIHPSPDKGERHEVVIDVDDLMKRGDMHKNVLLQEGDIVYVPPTPLAWVGLRLREVLFPVSPVAQTIVAPAAVAASVDVYQDENNDNNNGNRRSRRAASIGGFP